MIDNFIEVSNFHTYCSATRYSHFVYTTTLHLTYCFKLTILNSFTAHISFGRCKFCDEVFTTKKRRTRHMDLEHYNYVYRCKICEFESRDPHLLKLHISSVRV